MSKIKASDFYQDDGALKTAIAELEALANAQDVSLKKIRDAARELTKALSSASSATSTGRSEVEAAAKAAENLAKEQDKLTAASSATGKELTRLRKRRQELTAIQKLEIQLNDAEVGSQQAIEAQYKLNLIALSNMTREKRLTTEAGIQLTNQTIDLKDKMDEYKNSLKKSVPVLTELEKEQQRYNDAISDEAIELAKLRKKRKQAIKIQELQIQVSESAEGSQEQIRAQYELNVIALSKLSEAEIQTSEAAKELIEQTEELKEAIDDFKESIGTFPLGRFLDNLEDMPGAAGGAVRGIKSLDSGFKKLIKNPIIAVIALVVSGLTALGAAFAQSETGANFLAQASGVLSSLWGNVIQLASRIGETIIWAFTNPKEAVFDFLGVIKNQIVVRVQGLINLFGAVGRSIVAAFKLDLTEFKKQAAEAATAVAQVVSGLDEAGQEELVESIKEVVEEVAKEAKAFARLEARKRSLKKAARGLTVAIEELATKEAELQVVVDDTTRSFKEREEASAAVRDLLEQRAAKELKLATNSLNLIREEIRLRKANAENVEDLKDQELAAIQARMAAQRDYLVAVKTNEKEERELTQDRAERDLDFQLDIFDNQKTINERKIQDENLTFKERMNLQKETEKLNEDSFMRQIAILQQFTDETIDANDFINDSDAESVRIKARNLGLSEILEGRLIEVIRDRKSANQDLAESSQELQEEEAKRIEKSEKAEKKRLEAEYKGKLEAFKQQQDFEKSEFDLLKSTEAEKTRFKIEAEKARIKKLLELNKEYGNKLTETEIKTLNNRLAKLSAEFDNVEEAPQDIFGKLGLNLKDEQKEGLVGSFELVKNELGKIAEARLEAANQAVEQSNTEVDSAQSALDAQIAARERGEAADVEGAAKALDNAKKNQKKAIQEQQKAQRQQLAIESIQQASSLITASAKIASQLGIFSAPAIALMFGSFLAAKVKAFQATRKNFGKGGYDVIGGGSHASGNDTFIGIGSGGTHDYAEGGEGRAIFNRRSTKQYGSYLPFLVDSINQGRLFETLQARHANAISDIPFYNIQGESADTSLMEGHLATIAENTGYQDNRDAQGKGIVRRGNTTTRYV